MPGNSSTKPGAISSAHKETEMSIHKHRKPEDDWPESLTKQSFKDSTDINKIINKHARAGTLSHLEQFGGQYGDFSDFDFFEAQTRLARARSIFEQLPPQVRADFANDPSRFFEFVAGKSPSELRQELPQLLDKGVQWPNLRPQRAVDAAGDAVPPEGGTPATPPAPPASGASGGSETP